MTQPLSCDIPIEPAHTALLFVDVQKHNCTWDGGEYALLSEPETGGRVGYFARMLEDRALPHTVALQRAGRRAGTEVLYTVNRGYCRQLTASALVEEIAAAARGGTACP